jgi:hypothetical protein
MGLLSRIKAPLNRASWAMALLGTFVSLGAFLAAFEAFADPSYAETHPAWTNSSQYVECGQDCLYQKANEKVTLQAIYLVKKISNLQAVLAGGGSDNYDHVVSELQLYCPDKVGSKKIDDAVLCFKRYVQTQLPILRALKVTLIKNEDMTAQLMSNQGGLGANSKSTAFQDSTAVNRRPQTPDIEKEGELLMPSQASADRLKYLASTSYEKWAQDVSKLAPKPEDFFKTEQVMMPDPNHQGSLKPTTKIIRDKYGPVLDANAYAKAKKEFEDHVLGKQSVEYDLTKVAKTTGSGKKQLYEVDPSLLAQLKPAPGTKPKSTTRVEDVSYQEARNLIVASEVKNFMGGVMPEQSFSGPNRTTASAGGSQAAKTDKVEKEPKTGYDQVTQPVADVAPFIPHESNKVFTIGLKSEDLEESISSFQDTIDKL